MSYSVRRATAVDADVLADHRARVWIEVGDWAPEALAEQIPQWAAFFRRSIADETYVAWIAEEIEGLIIGSGALLIQRAVPRPGFSSDESGRVHSVYVIPAARRRGIARSVMDALLSYARERALIGLTLHPSDEARSLYESLGFHPADEMTLRLAPQ